MTHGPKTTATQYNSDIQALGATPDPRQKMAVQVAHRLGTDFPKPRRAELEAVASRLSSHWMSAGANALLQSLVGKPMFAESGTPLVVVASYAPHLNDSELADLWLLLPEELAQWVGEIAHARAVGAVTSLNENRLPH